MIKNYDPNIPGFSTVRATFMYKDFVGHIAFEVLDKESKGGDFLDCGFLDYDSQEEIDSYVENDCQFSFNEVYDCLEAVLVNEQGEKLAVNSHDIDFHQLVVCLEIANFREE